MWNVYLTNVERKGEFNFRCDIGEKVAEFGLGLLRIGFGKTVSIEKISSGQPFINEKMYTSFQKVVAVALFLLAFPITLLLAGIGCIGAHFSKSQHEILRFVNLNLLSERMPRLERETQEEKQKPIDFIKFNEIFLNKVPSNFKNSYQTNKVIERYQSLLGEDIPLFELKVKFFAFLDFAVSCKNSPMFINGNTVSQAKQAFFEFMGIVEQGSPIKDFCVAFLEKVPHQYKGHIHTLRTIELFVDTLQKSVSFEGVQNQFFVSLDSAQSASQYSPQFINGSTVSQAKQAFLELKEAAAVSSSSKGQL